MKTFNFKDPQGRSLTVNSPDGSVPSESELDQMFSNKYGNSSQPDVFTPPQQTPSIATQGLSYVKEHPYKSFFDPATKSLTGSSALEISQQEPVSNRPDQPVQNFVKGFHRDVAAAAGDFFTTPANLATMGVAAIPGVKQVGGAALEAIGNNKIGQGIGKVLNSPINKIGSKIGESFGNVRPKPIQDLANIMQPKKFAEEVRNSTFQLRKDLGTNLDANIRVLSDSNPTERIDLTNEFQQVKDVMNDPELQGLKSDINSTIRKIKNPQLTRRILDYIKNPDSASDLTLAESEEIKKVISNSSPISAKAKQGKFANWTSGDRELLDLVDNIKLRQAEKFDNLSEIRKPYADYMQSYNKLKSKFREGNLLRSMRGKFGDEEIEPLVKNIVHPDIYNKMIGFRRTGNTVKVLGGATGLVGTEELLRRMFRR